MEPFVSKIILAFAFVLLFVSPAISGLLLGMLLFSKVLSKYNKDIRPKLECVDD